MRFIGRSVVVLSACALASALSIGCSSNTSGHDGGTAGGGGHGGGAGKDAGAGAGGQSGSVAGSDGSTTDTKTDTAPDGAAGASDAKPDAEADAFPADLISPDVVSTDSADTLTLTSTALTEGSAFPSANTCAGANMSPTLTWTAGPTGTMSYAIVLTDLSIDAVHWVIWDIPAGTTSLAADLPGDSMLTTPTGAKQVHKLEFFGAGGSYKGPCPSGNKHVYQFEVDAIGTATLAGVTTTSATADIKAVVQAASLAHGDLEGTSDATAPASDAGGQ
jgi:Raf kinase inhibitor-like YbhB/YbcL family protein